MSVGIELQLDKCLSRKACAVVIKHIIKFIVYNNQQIPYTYDGFQQLVVKKRRNGVVEKGKAKTNNPLSFKQIRANTFYEKIESVYDAFETTFKCIEEELISGNIFKEIAIIFGATLVSPKHIYRIQIPELSYQDDGDQRIRSHLFKIYRSILSCENNHFAGKCTGLTNIFILIHGDCKSSVEKGWFVPKYDFRVPLNASQTLISFLDPTDDVGVNSQCSAIDSDELTCELEFFDNSCVDIQKKMKLSRWFLARPALSGFHDMKIDGESVYNLLSGSDGKRKFGSD